MYTEVMTLGVYIQVTQTYTPFMAIMNLIRISHNTPTICITFATHLLFNVSITYMYCNARAVSFLIFLLSSIE